MTDRGQASVEFALVLPLVLLLGLVLLQVAVVVRDQLALGVAAREGARAAAVAADPGGAARSAVGRVLPLPNPEVGTTVSGALVTVEVRARATALPVVGSMIARRDLTAAATMALEPP